MWLNGKESACQLRGCGLDPQIGKILWRRKQQPTPLFLPGKLHGQKSPVVYSPWDCRKLDTTEHTHRQSILIHTRNAVSEEMSMMDVVIFCNIFKYGLALDFIS